MTNPAPGNRWKPDNPGIRSIRSIRIITSFPLLNISAFIISTKAAHCGPRRCHAAWQSDVEFLLPQFGAGLRKDFRCIVPDHIGCGLSDKPQDYLYTLAQHIENLESLLDALKLHEIDLVLHDWGGAIGMGAALRNLSASAALSC